MPLSSRPMSGPVHEGDIALGVRDKPISLGYHAGLDGLRGLALVAIIIYHSQVGWAPGAFLSVSTFFTLSGFLITSLLLVEHLRTGRISLKNFWNRRLRRLMPAATVAIVVIIFGAWVFGDSSQLARMRGDSLGALGYLANWRFIAAGDAYGATFASPSPFTHFWTLAIEEQFYLILPALVTAVLAVGSGSRRALAAVLGGLVIASLIWAHVLLGRDVALDRLYWGTDVRVVEFLAGSLLAIAWSYRPTPFTGIYRHVVDAVSSLALIAMLALWATAHFDSPVVYRGGLAAYSSLTLAVIIGVLQPGSAVQRVLAFRPLAWVGVVSYGAYLAHFPILTWLEANSRWTPPTRLFVAFPMTLAVAGISSKYLERPIRSGKRLRGARPWVYVPTAMAVTAALIFGVSSIAAPQSRVDPFAGLPQIFDRDLARLAQVVGDSTAPRVSFYGDSSALMSSLGILEYSIERPNDIVSELGSSKLGCALLANATRVVRDVEEVAPEYCDDWQTDWAEAAAEHPVDVAVVQLGPFDVTDHRLVDGGPTLTIGEDEALDSALSAALQIGVDSLLKHAGTVVLLASPDIDVGRIDGRSRTEPYSESDPERMERFREILAEVAASTNGVVVVDLAAWIAERDDDATLRPDGVHFTPETTELVAEWLAPQLLKVHLQRTGSTETLL